MAPSKKPVMLTPPPAPPDKPFVMKGFSFEELSFNAGARHERKALLTKIRREIRERKCSKDDHPIAINPMVLVMIEEWILDREKRALKRGPRYDRR